MVIRSIREILKGRKPLGIAPGTTLAEACDIMSARGLDVLLVMDGGHLQGVLTERDVIRHVSQHGGLETTPVSAVMTRDVATIGTRDSIQEALSRMLAGGHRHLPVIDTGHAVIGVLSLKDIPEEYRLMHRSYRRWKLHSPGQAAA